MKLSVLPSARFGLNGLYEESLLKTTTLVGIEALRLTCRKTCRNVSRTCSSLVATLRMSFSEAFPIRKKFFDRTWIQSSLADAARGAKVRINSAKHVTKQILWDFITNSLIEFFESLRFERHTRPPSFCTRARLGGTRCSLVPA